MSVLVRILELHLELTKVGKVIVFVWAPSHVGFRENSAEDCAAKDAIDDDVSDKFIFSGLKPHWNKYQLALWPSEWGEYPHNELHN